MCHPFPSPSLSVPSLFLFHLSCSQAILTPHPRELPPCFAAAMNNKAPPSQASLQDIPGAGTPNGGNAACRGAPPGLSSRSRRAVSRSGQSAADRTHRHPLPPSVQHKEEAGADPAASFRSCRRASPRSRRFFILHLRIVICLFAHNAIRASSNDLDAYSHFLERLFLQFHMVGERSSFRKDWNPCVDSSPSPRRTRRCGRSRRERPRLRPRRGQERGIFHFPHRWTGIKKPSP